MKRLITGIWIWGLCAGAFAQEMSCRYGFSYEISNSPHWGKNKPVITSVYPYSPAQRAELKPFDIIMEVEGTLVTDSVLDDIHLFMNPDSIDIVELTIKNINGIRKVKVKKECKSMLSLSETQLASAFAMYAVEDNYDRLFTCPFVTSLTNDVVDFSEFITFDFVSGNDEQPELAKKINDMIRKELMNKGLQHNPDNPDLLVQIYYSFNKNPNFKPKTTNNEVYIPISRYNVILDRWAKLPLLPPSTIETEAEYILKLGFRLEDRKFVRGRILWECEANELMNESFSIDEYASIHIPLMSMQFPYMKYGRNVQFRLSKKKYNYTGINFSADQISEVASIDHFSPASSAGIIPSDQIDAIADKRMDRTAKQFTSAYHQFILSTLKHRDVSTRFTDANGFPDCIEWDTNKYPMIVKEFSAKKNLTVFSYLFQYAPFINPAGNSTCSIKLRRGKEKLEFILHPEIRSEITVIVD